MNNILRIVGVILLILSIHSCKKEERPILTTDTVTNISGNTATSGGTITNEGSGGITAKGVCWAFIEEPTVDWYKTNDGTGAGSFTSNMTGLYGGHTYYVRAYATNSAGIGYGMAQSFKTLGQAPSATTNSATNFTVDGATLNGTVNANYLSTDVIFEYGTTTTYGQTITAIQSPVTGTSDTNVTAKITGLIAGTTYHYRIEAINYLNDIWE
jgi:hypothetical protein